jgi:hypothetical protein
MSDILSLLLYSGNSKVLKQVWLVGSLLLSGPSRWMMHLSTPNPPIGALQHIVGQRCHHLNRGLSYITLLHINARQLSLQDTKGSAV